MDATLWTLTARLPDLPRLDDDLECDACIVGAGIAGLATAYRLAAAGRKVVVLDAEGIAAGETHHTSAHLASAQDDRVYRIAERFGDDGARQVVESHEAAVDWIEDVVRAEGIDCDFQRVPGYLFLREGDGADLLERELSASRAAGLEVRWVEHAPMPGGDVGPALRFERQGELHPLRFLAGLAEALERKGGRIYGGARVVDVRSGDPSGVETAHGPVVTADAVLLATNSPANRYLITMKMVPYRTFLVAMRATGEIPRALFWDTGHPYHYVRRVDDAQGTVVLSGGGDYQAGTKDEGDRVFQALESWTRMRFPVGETLHRWSGQVFEPSDWLAFIGRLGPEASRVYACTGDSGQGLTHGAICALLVGDLIQGKAHRWEEIYSPRRLTLGAAGAYVADAAKIASNFVDWLLPGEVSSEDAVPPGRGAVLRDGAKLIAIYRDARGDVHRRSAVCTHAGCIVHWDSSARIWACPCHGSRFHPTGEVINGPATAGLAEVASEAAASERAGAQLGTPRADERADTGAPRMASGETARGDAPTPRSMRKAGRRGSGGRGSGAPKL